MSPTERMEQRMLVAARAEAIPRGRTFEQIREGILARATAADVEPEWRGAVEPEGTRAHPAIWLGVALLAASGLLLAVLVAPRWIDRDTASARGAAVYDQVPIPDGGQSVVVPPKASFSLPPSTPLDAPPDPVAGSPQHADPDPEAATRREPQQKKRARSRREDAEPPAPDVAGETALLRAAQKALAQHDLPQASAALRNYRSRYPSGNLRPEADGIAVLVRCGERHPNAGQRAAAFLRRHPRSPLASRVRRACKIDRSAETKP